MSVDDPHFVCSHGARNCADCGDICTETDPCPCCGGTYDDECGGVRSE